MILVVSRFRVKNDKEAAVRTAFFDRPHLVDRVPGFLGMEVFTAAEDAALFYLVTRWTDVDSFRQWHASDAHHQSHQGIPRGLKLDPAFTEVITLHRLHDFTRQPDLGEFAADAAPLLARHLAATGSIHVLAATPDGKITMINPALAALIKVPADQIVGQSLWQYLPDADAAALKQRIHSADSRSTERLFLNVVDTHDVPYTLECFLDAQPDGFILVGEPPLRQNQALQEEMQRLNNELAVLSRENVRKSRDLEKANAELDKTLEELRTSHWHLKKLQEVLPICMNCSKVKAGTAGWQDVVQYLKDNALFLSHGYCPECEAKLEAEWGLKLKGE